VMAAAMEIVSWSDASVARGADWLVRRGVRVMDIGKVSVRLQYGCQAAQRGDMTAAPVA
jgi:hypothetical protein